jgi:thiosulfate reductase cytochrome b subunit
VILTGLTMSPRWTPPGPGCSICSEAASPARSIHFICAMLFALFILVHLIMVLLAGPINEVRSMITGRYRLPRERTK